MQIKFFIENIEEIENNSSDIFLKSSSSISSWIIDYYFTNIYVNQLKESIQPKYIIGISDMFMIYQRMELSLAFFDLCKNKFKQIKTNFIIDNYNKYLNRCGLMDIIDLFHQCQFDTLRKRIHLSINNIQNNIDRLVFEYFIELSSTSWEVYDEKTKLTTIETKENLFKLIDDKRISDEQINSKNSLKHTLCTYLSLLLDTRNEHALIHCLFKPACIGIEREILVELQCLGALSKNKDLTIYQILLSFLRRKELALKRISSEDSINNDNKSFDGLEKYYHGIKEFFDFIEQLRMIIEDDEQLKIESIVTLRKLLELISKQLGKDKSFNQDDLLIKEITEEFCQCFQTIINCTSPIRSASSGTTLAGRRFLRSIAYLCAKQTIHLPILIPNDECVEEKVVNVPKEPVVIWQSKTMKKSRSLDLSTIHETSFESDSIIPDQKLQLQSTVKRQPLREIDINSFNNEEREIDNEKKSDQNSVGFTLVSEGDKENLPVIRRKRSMLSTKNEPPSKKHKKMNVKPPEVGQKMITSFFQSIS